MEDTRSGETVLDDAELRLLSLVAEGHSLRRVANGLAISESTARRRLSAIQRRLGGRSRINTVYIAAKRGLI